MRIRPARVLVAAAAMALVGVVAWAQGADTTPGVTPPHAKHRGLTYGEWAAVWWQEALSLPFDGGSHPLAAGGAFGADDGIVFLGGAVQPAGSPTPVIQVTVPSGTRLFFPIITVGCSEYEPPPFHGDDEASLRACANDLLDLVSSVSAEIDGRPVHNLAAYRVDSPLFEWGPLPANNILGAPEGTVSPAVSAGYFLMLPPLSVGVHQIVFHAEVPDFGIAADAEFIVTVEPRGRR